VTTETQPLTRTLAVPGATIAYDLRETDSAEPVLLLIGSPMGAAGFGTLAAHFPDRTVATYDPRGVDRSTKDDPATESTPEQHADDLHRVIVAIGRGPVDLFASSGGAVNALALVAAHPGDVRTLVAHEPPLAGLVADREAALAACRAVRDAYQRDGFGAGMARFIAVVGHPGPFTQEDAAGPGPDPVMFGLPVDDDGNRTDPLLFQNIITCTHYQPDIDALRAASTRIVIAVGVGSDGQLACRGGLAVATRLGSEAVRFPGDHGGFMGGEHGQAGEPDAFAARLREVLGTA
jgi:pimeloyl-ACP methyl ester carboxylesterase